MIRCTLSWNRIRNHPSVCRGPTRATVDSPVSYTANASIRGEPLSRLVWVVDGETVGTKWVVGALFDGYIKVGALLAGSVVSRRMEYFDLISVPSVLLASLLPMSVYLDAVALIERDAGWQPNPALHYFISLMIFTPLVALAPIYAGYYLVRRRWAAG